MTSPESPAVQDTDRLRALLRQAIADPGSVLPRQPEETVPRWSARAVEALVLPAHRAQVLREMADDLRRRAPRLGEALRAGGIRYSAAVLLAAAREPAVSAPPTPPGSPPADERATVVETGRTTQTVGICGDRAETLAFGIASALLCILPSGHAGWHHSEGGADWTMDDTSPPPPAAVPGTGDDPGPAWKVTHWHCGCCDRGWELTRKGTWYSPFGDQPIDGFADAMCSSLDELRAKHPNLTPMEADNVPALLAERDALAAERDRLLHRAFVAEDKLDLVLVNRAEVIEARDRLALDLQARDIAVREADRLREQVEAERDALRYEREVLGWASKRLRHERDRAVLALGDLRGREALLVAERDDARESAASFLNDAGELAQTIRRYEPVIEAAKAWLAYGWNGSARLTAGIEALGDIPSSQLPEVGEPGSTVGDGAQPPDIPSPTAPEAPLSQLDGAMHSIWLHGNWRWLTKNMTTPEKEATLAAVLRHDRAMKADEADLGGELLTEADWAWWREPARAEPEGTPDADT